MDVLLLTLQPTLHYSSIDGHIKTERKDKEAELDGLIRLSDIFCGRNSCVDSGVIINI